MQQVREQMQSASPPPDSGDVSYNLHDIKPTHTANESVEVDYMAGGEPNTLSSASSSAPVKVERGQTSDAEFGSPAKSTTSADGGGATSATSPVPTTAEGTPEKKHKKKRGFRMPSFSSKKKEK